MVLAILCAAAYLATSCTRAADAPPTDGILLVTEPQAISELDLATMERTVVITLDPGAGFLLDATLSPAGSQIAYVVQPPPTVNGTAYDSGSDLWVANRDGSQQRLVFKHDIPSLMVRYPQWIDDDTLLAVTQEPTAPRGTIVLKYAIDRFDVNSGVREPVADGALMFDVSRDRQAIVFTSLSQQHDGHALEVVSVAGSGARSAEPPEQPAAPYYYFPRWSPDGRDIAFAAPDPLLVAEARSVQLIALAPEPAPDRHGAPQDIWLMPSDASAPATRVAALQEDAPVLTWDDDGSHLYVLAVGGLYRVDVAGRTFERIGEGAFHGQLIWARE